MEIEEQIELAVLHAKQILCISDAFIFESIWNDEDWLGVQVYKNDCNDFPELWHQIGLPPGFDYTEIEYKNLEFCLADIIACYFGRLDVKDYLPMNEMQKIIQYLSRQVDSRIESNFNPNISS